MRIVASWCMDSLKPTVSLLDLQANVNKIKQKLLLHLKPVAARVKAQKRMKKFFFRPAFYGSVNDESRLAFELSRLMPTFHVVAGPGCGMNTNHIDGGQTWLVIHFRRTYCKQAYAATSGSTLQSHVVKRVGIQVRERSGCCRCCSQRKKPTTTPCFTADTIYYLIAGVRKLQNNTLDVDSAPDGIVYVYIQLPIAEENADLIVLLVYCRIKASNDLCRCRVR